MHADLSLIKTALEKMMHKQLHLHRFEIDDSGIRVYQREGNRESPSFCLKFIRARRGESLTDKEVDDIIRYFADSKYRVLMFKSIRDLKKVSHETKSTLRGVDIFLTYYRNIVLVGGEERSVLQEHLFKILHRINALSILVYFLRGCSTSHKYSEKYNSRGVCAKCYVAYFPNENGSSSQLLIGRNQRFSVKFSPNLNSQEVYLEFDRPLSDCIYKFCKYRVECEKIWRTHAFPRQEYPYQDVPRCPRIKVHSRKALDELFRKGLERMDFLQRECVRVNNTWHVVGKGQMEDLVWGVLFRETARSSYTCMHADSRRYIIHPRLIEMCVRECLNVGIGDEDSWSVEKDLRKICEDALDRLFRNYPMLIKSRDSGDHPGNFINWNEYAVNIQRIKKKHIVTEDARLICEYF